MQSKDLGSTISDLVDLREISKSFSVRSNVYFRGQSEDWPLLPTIARIAPRHSTIEDESGMFQEFKDRARKKLREKSPDNDWDWLAVAQHYGLPTRLLDWSQDPFTALWFAVRRPPRDTEKRGVLWIFAPDSKDIIDNLAKRKPFRGSRTKVFVPETKLLDERIKAQKGAFTVHKYMNGTKEFIPLENNRRQKTKLRKFKIHPEFFPKLRRALYEQGTNDFSLFPDLEGLTRTIIFRHCKSPDEFD